MIPRQFESFVPPRLGRWRKELVVASAIAEIAGGIAAAGSNAALRALVAARDAGRRLPGQHQHGPQLEELSGHSGPRALGAVAVAVLVCAKHVARDSLAACTGMRPPGPKQIPLRHNV